MDHSNTFLQKALKANALFSLVSGILFSVFYQAIGSLIGIQPLMMTLVTGLILVLFSAFVWYVSKQEPVNRLLVWLIIDLDLLWVIFTIISIVNGMYTTAGNWIMGILSLLVLDFAIAQYIGLRKSKNRIQTAKS